MSSRTESKCLSNDAPFIVIGSSETDPHTTQQMLERVTQEKAMCEEEGRREKRKSDQLQESMTSLRMVSL